MDTPPTTDDELAATGVRVVSFGCRLNTLESEVMRRSALAAGLGTKGRAPDGGAIVFNTCAVTGEAVRQARKEIRKARRDHPGARIVVTGCAAQVRPQDFAAMPEVDAVLGNGEKLVPDSFRALPDFGVAAEEKCRVDDIMSIAETAGHMVEAIEGRARAIVQVQNGCDHRCTFCIIPFGRGNSRSVPMGAVVDQVKRIVAAGTKEVVLSGVDMTSWGLDLPGGRRLGDLVQAILRHVPNLVRLRLSSIDSVEADPALVEAIAGEPRLMPHLHLSLQAGDDLILKRMKRRHGRDDAIGFCAAMRAARPDIVFGADLIAGFPTETDAMFEQSLKLVDECGLTHLHVFPFSPREGTPAARMPQLPRGVVKARAARLRLAGGVRADAHRESLLGRRRSLLLERGGIARCEDFTPCRVDPWAFAAIEAPRVRSRERMDAAAAGALPGTLLDAIIWRHADGDLFARPFSSSSRPARPAFPEKGTDRAHG